MLTFKQIEALYWVVQLGGFANAAERLNTTQSAITKRIQDLEGQFDVQIFDRSSQKATLTRTGEDLLAMASDLLNRRDRMLLRLKKPGRFPGALRLGITEVTAITWLPRLMQAMGEHFPELIVQPRIGMAWQLQQNLLHGQLDMAIIQGEVGNPLLAVEPLGQMEFVWTGSPAVLAEDTVYTPADIARMKIIRQDPESALNAIYDEWLAPHTAESNLFTINSVMAMIGLTVAGFGIACIPTAFTADLVSKRKLVLARTTKPNPTSMYCAMVPKRVNEALYREVATIARGVCDYSSLYGDAS